MRREVRGGERQGGGRDGDEGEMGVNRRGREKGGERY